VRTAVPSNGGDRPGAAATPGHAAAVGAAVKDPKFVPQATAQDLSFHAINSEGDSPWEPRSALRRSPGVPRRQLRGLTKWFRGFCPVRSAMCYRQECLRAHQQQLSRWKPTGAKVTRPAAPRRAQVPPGGFRAACRAAHKRFGRRGITRNALPRPCSRSLGITRCFRTHRGPCQPNYWPYRSS
jgi:hypothetical protein